MIRFSAQQRLPTPTLEKALQALSCCWMMVILLAFPACSNSPDLDQSIRSCECPPSPEGSVKGALLSTRFTSYEALEDAIQIEYYNDSASADGKKYSTPKVHLIHCSDGQEIISVLKEGVDEGDFKEARDGNLWDKICLGFSSPYTLMNKNDLQRVFLLARRRSMIFGEGDVAFYDLAETMVCNMRAEDLALASAQDRTEKGYINTFNHVTAQAFMTTIFSEDLADFIADAHERHHLPELITGDFTEKQLQDLNKGPVDNYVDILNNEWGQELGKRLTEKYRIKRSTHWTPELLANYLNDVQSYYSWSLQIGFHPFTPEDEVVIKFAAKINRVLGEMSLLRSKN